MVAPKAFGALGPFVVTSCKVDNSGNGVHADGIDRAAVIDETVKLDAEISRQNCAI